MRDDWSSFDLGGHAVKCAIWDSDFGVCNCGQVDGKWRGKQNGCPHPEWLDSEVVRRVLSGEATGRPVSEIEARTAIPILLARGVSVLEMSERMKIDRRWVDEWVKGLTNAQPSGMIPEVN